MTSPLQLTAIQHCQLLIGLESVAVALYFGEMATPYCESARRLITFMTTMTLIATRDAGSTGRDDVVYGAKIDQ